MWQTLSDQRAHLGDVRLERLLRLRRLSPLACIHHLSDARTRDGNGAARFEAGRTQSAWPASKARCWRVHSCCSTAWVLGRPPPTATVVDASACTPSSIRRRSSRCCDSCAAAWWWSRRCIASSSDGWIRAPGLGAMASSAVIRSVACRACLAISSSTRLCRTTKRNTITHPQRSAPPHTDRRQPRSWEPVCMRDVKQSTLARTSFGLPA